MRLLISALAIVALTTQADQAERIRHATTVLRSEEHTSELQSRQYLVCRLLLEKKNEKTEVQTFQLSQDKSNRSERLVHIVEAQERVLGQDQYNPGTLSKQMS